MNLADLILPSGAGGRPPRAPGDPYTGITPVSYATGKTIALAMELSTVAQWESLQQGEYNGIGFRAAGPLSDGRYYVIGEMVSTEAIGDGGPYANGFLGFEYADLEGIEVLTMAQLQPLLVYPQDDGG